MMKPLYLELPAVAEVIALAPATIQRCVREGTFPAPRQISGRRVGWLVRELEEWAESRPKSELPPPSNTMRRTNA
jgi:prophage regulatory protein